MSNAVDTNTTGPTWDEGLHNQFMAQVWLALPILFQVTFYPLMAVATLAGELRILTRIYKRRRINVHEGVFLLLKHLFLGATIGLFFAWFVGPGWATVGRCYATYWFVKWASFSCGTLLTLTMALRTYVVLGHARWAGAVLLLGLLIHYGGAMMMTAMDLNMNDLIGGHCTSSGAGAPDGYEWDANLAYSVLFDLFMVSISCVKLAKAAGGIKNMQKTTALLFRHNVHYLFAVTSINLAQLIGMVTGQDFFYTTMAALSIQVVLALNQIISEQDSVNGYVPFTGEPLWVSARKKEKQKVAIPQGYEGGVRAESIPLRQRPHQGLDV